MEKAKRDGMNSYKVELNKKISILEKLLIEYNDGRRKGFYCLAVNLVDLHDIIEVMERIEIEIAPDMLIKEKAAVAVKLFTEMADRRGISLKLRK
jgi:hypothetical protein